ncbi:hypothetical protein PVAND_005445 [Polypedilum vanderplanki]|uniref:Glycerate kinase n=1 Tax=Polypedilum vanderplanki TaxID=319348 RepID=A0A9J6C124_POLVA|nr:hypothetical protein PVAND_005445 [Polypedilum vanderplanki]
MENIIKDIFYAAVESVKPSELITKNKFLSLKNIENREIIELNQNNESYQLDATNKRLHIVGFGKASLPLAIELESILKERITGGILSVPVNATKYHSLSKNSKLHVFEGAAGNLPDYDSMRNAEKIKNYILNLNNDDILFCLITGGGSALLSLPIEPITLDEKTALIKQLSRAGASINELNTVRIAISQVKGGKLALMAKNVHKIISLIISDIINDPLELIASGPTIPYKIPSTDELSPLQVLEKYIGDRMENTLSPSILNTIKNMNEKNQDSQMVIKNSQTFLLGNNRNAIDAAMNQAKIHNFVPVYLSASVQGNVNEISVAFFELACAIQSYSSASTCIEFANSLKCILEKLNAQTNFVADLIEALNQKSSDGICIVSSGETVVKVNCNEGIGGRSQELCLRFTKLCYDAGLSLDNLLFLSAGTDGIDGNNDAAGAIGGTRILRDIKENVACVMSDYIYRNDSYRFYKNFIGKYSGDGYHIHTGITGTNVMDIHLLMIMPKVKLS